MRLNLSLAWRLLRAQWQAGDVRVLVLALVLAITALTAVSFFTNRVGQQLKQQGASLLGADAVLIADHPITPQRSQQSMQRGLHTASTLEFTSMAIHGERNQLAEIKAIDAHFPLIGSFGVQTKPPITHNVVGGPARGEVWLAPALAQTLNITLGDRLVLGASQFKVSGWIVGEPSRGGGLMNLAPRVMMHLQDVPATQLLQFGSRVKYSLAVSGRPAQVQAWQQAVRPQLQAGEHIEEVSAARPEIRAALNKADTFLGLSALVTVMLSVVAMLLSSQPFIGRCQEAAVLLRVFGANTRTIRSVMTWQAVFLAGIGALLGCVLGFLVQFGLAEIVGNLFVERLPAPNWTPIGLGVALSFSIVLSLMWPSIHALRQLSPMQRLRAGVPPLMPSAWRHYLPLLAVIVSFVLILAQSLALAFAFIAGIAGLSLIAGAAAYAMALALHRFSDQRALPMSLVLGLRNLKRRLTVSLIQIVGFSLGAMVLMLITMIKTDLLQAWQQSLPQDAPNQFVINIQPDQVAAMRQRLSQMPIVPAQPTLYAMIRGRLIEKNGTPMHSDQFQDERAKRLIDREFNLSGSGAMHDDNQLVQGQWWGPQQADAKLISLEQGIAKTLNIQLGDILTFDIAGQNMSLQVASIREVKWDNLRPNFFAVTPPLTLAGFPTSYLTAFQLPATERVHNQRLVQTFPNISVIDMGSVLTQIRDILAKLTLAVSFIFAFCIAAGLVVLTAALVATRLDRAQEASLLRALGASKKQVVTMLLTEYLSIAWVSATVAVLIANLLGAYVSTQLLDIPFHWNLSLSLSVYSLALVLIPLAAWLVIRRLINLPPKQVLHSL